MADLLRQGRIQAGSPLLDVPEVEPRGVGNRLEVEVLGIRGSGVDVTVIARDGWELAGEQSRHRRGEAIPEIGVLNAAAIPSPPAAVHGELHQVGESPDLLGTGGFA